MKEKRNLKTGALIFEMTSSEKKKEREQKKSPGILHRCQGTLL